MKKIAILLASAIGAFTVGTTVIGSLSWFIASKTFNEIDIEGTSAAAYFAYGDGTSEQTAFGIKTPRQLYNLAWLQYNGNFNKNSAGAINQQYYFELANDIDMTGWTLPPIGTEDNPFLGVFNGNEHIITGLTVSNKSNLSKPNGITYSVQPEVVGLFGVVGGGAKAVSYTYDPDIVELKNVTIKDITVESKTTSTLVGLAAGYINGEMSGVKVDGNAKLDINDQVHTAKSAITSNITDYGLVGYSENKGNTGNSYAQHLSEYYNNGGGTGHGGNNFGDSIDMLSLYGRLSKIYNEEAYDNASYTIDTINYPDGTIEKQKIEACDSDKKPINAYSGIYGNDYSYTFNKNSGGSQDFYYLYGAYSPVSGTKTDNIYTASVKNGNATQWKISQSDNYYTFSSSGQYLKIPVLGNNTSANITTSDKTSIEDNATKFTRIKNGSEYRFYATEIYNGTTYYVFLAHSGSSTFKVQKYNSPTSSYATIRWNLDNNNNLYSGTSYLIYNNNKFGYNTSGTKAKTNNYSNTFYLVGTSDGFLNKDSSSENATIFYFENNKLFFIDNNRTYYLTYNGSRLTTLFKIAENNATSWVFAENQLSFNFSNTTYYLNMSTQQYISSSVTETNMTNIGSGSLKDVLYISSITTQNTQIPINSFKDTYFPISTNNNIFSTANKNSGYIISGGKYNGSSISGYNNGDIRVSRYDMDNIRESMGQSTFDNNKMYVITATNDSNYSLVTDGYNGGSSAPSGLSGITSRTASTNLQRYNAWTDENGINHDGARYSIGQTFTTDSDNIYGLHFMEVNIDRSDLINHRDDNIVTVPNAKINGTTYTDGLEMVKDSIDFFVNQNGYITFFAGTYFNGNNAFFSLSKVERNADNTIKSIDEIKTIYKDASNNYYYNPNSTSGLTKVFDTKVLTNPSTFISNAVYYFEIPVGQGEFALGCTTKNGAYLMYLDISASGESVIKDEIGAYHITTIETGNTFPLGVDFAPVSVSGNGGESIGVYIESGNTGTITFNVQSASSKITINGTSNLSTYHFQGSKYSASPGEGYFIVDGNAPPDPLETPSEGGTRVLTIDVGSIENDKTYHAHIIDKLDDDGAIIQDSTTYEIDYANGSGFVTATLNEILALSGELTLDSIVEFRALNEAASLTRSNNTQNIFITTYDTANSSYDDKKIDVDITTNGTFISISVEDGYSLYISGVRYYNGSTYPQS